MRQIGILPSEEQAKRFIDYLLTQGVEARADEEADDTWAVWIIDEEQIARAGEELRQFQADPQQPRYLDGAGQAENIRQRERKKREAAAKNVVQMRGKWQQGLKRKAPLTFLLIAAAVLVGLLTKFDFSKNNNVAVQALLFRNPARLTVADLSHVDPWTDIRRGEAWRVVSPMLLHGNLLHLLFNLYWLWYFGSQIEDRRGTLRFALLVLIAAAVSNVAQAMIVDPWFGGLSGVNYALFGYAWMKSRYEPRLGIYVTPSQAFLLVVWFFVCFTGWVGPVANVAHGGGFFVGIAIGYLPMLIPQLEGKL
jgi:GlpG protein